jgi:hypothetical protein
VRVDILVGNRVWLVMEPAAAPAAGIGISAAVYAASPGGFADAEKFLCPGFFAKHARIIAKARKVVFVAAEPERVKGFTLEVVVGMQALEDWLALREG